MDWLQLLVLFSANAGLMLWFRAESRADWRHMDDKLDQYRLEAKLEINMIHESMKEFREAWAQESREFHGRLCAIEEKRIK